MGFTAMIALLVGTMAGPSLSGVLFWACAGLCGCALLAAVICNAMGKGRHFAVPAVLFTASLALFLFCRAWERDVRPLEALDGVEARVEGELLDYPEKQYHKTYYLLRVSKVDGEEGRFRPFTLRLSASDPITCAPGDRVECAVTFYSFQDGGLYGLYGLYSAKNTRLAKGVAIGGYLSQYGDVQVFPKTKTSFRHFWTGLRHGVSRGISQVLPRKEAGLIQAMLLGEDSGLSQEVQADFRRIGSSHLLVISGLHMAALAALLSRLFSRFPLGRVGKNLLSAGAILAFLCLTGFPVSALRSGTMYLLLLAADCFGRERDSLNSLGLAVLLICLLNPFSGGDLGFALSAFSTLGIITLEGPLEKLFTRPFGRFPHLSRPMRPAAVSLAITLSALLGSFPVQLVAFGGFSLISPLSNLLLVFPCTILLYISFAAAFFLLFPAVSAMALPILFCAGWLSRLAIWAVGMLGKLPGSYFSLGNGVWLALLGSLLLIWLTVFLGKRSRRVLAAALACSLVLPLTAGGLEALRWRDVVTVAVADQGEDLCVLLIKNGEASALCLNGFQTGAAMELLTENNVRRVNVIFLPQAGQEARESAKTIMERFPTRRLVLFADSYVGKDLEEEKTGVETAKLEKGGSVEVLPGVTVYAEDEDRLEVEANGVKAVVELGENTGGSCDLLFTTKKNSKTNSSFTVLLTDDIIGENRNAFWENASPGSYVLVGETGDLCVDLYPEGEMELRREG